MAELVLWKGVSLFHMEHRCFRAPTPLSLLCGRHRRLLLKAERRVNVQAVLGGWLGRVKTPAGVRVAGGRGPLQLPLRTSRRARSWDTL